MRSFGEEGEPALKVLRVERELEVLHHGVAFVAAGGEQNGGPEFLEQLEMIRPVTDDGVKDGANFRIEANLGVEGIDQDGDFFFGNARLHGRLLTLV